MLSIASDAVYVEITVRLVSALVVGALIGLERTYHGRPAGFRTHALVCLSTSLLMLVTVYEGRWFPGVTEGRVTLDPTRMALPSAGLLAWPFVKAARARGKVAVGKV